MLTVDTLRAFGANVDEGLGRCMGREDFYLRLVKMVRADTNIVRLREAMDAVHAFFEKEVPAFAGMTKQNN